MDDVVIEDVHDENSPLVRESVPELPVKNQDVSQLVVEFLSQYGMYLLVATVVFYLLIQHLKKRTSHQRETRPPAEPSEDAAFVVRRQEAMEASRRRMQEELNAQALIFRDKQKQKEEEKRKQKIEHYKGIVPSLGPEQTASSSSGKPLRSADYSPLSGGGGASCSWRPGRRGPSSGG